LTRTYKKEAGKMDEEIIVQETYNLHYIKTDETGRIIDGWSNGPCPDKETSGAICINEQGGYQFRLLPGGEENPPLRDDRGIPLYKWDGTQVVVRSQAEIDADYVEPEPVTPLEEQVRVLKGQLAAQQENAIILEECLVEMAGEVYA